MTLKDDLLIEMLAALEHEQWREWSTQIAKSENISQMRLKRWIKLWIPYSELTDTEKEHDRKWARKALEIIKEHEINWKEKQ